MSNKKKATGPDKSIFPVYQEYDNQIVMRVRRAGKWMATVSIFETLKVNSGNDMEFDSQPKGN